MAENREERESAKHKYTQRHLYNDKIEKIRSTEYPMLRDSIYLDHAGTTLYAKSLMESFSRSMTSVLYGNPHSMSSSSQTSTQLVADVRQQALKLFNADPNEFDLIFVQNASAGIKLVAECLRDAPGGFWFGYHFHAHTSIVGVRELATRGSRCFTSNEEVEAWIKPNDAPSHEVVQVLAYPAQSNMDGRRLPLDWCSNLRRSSSGRQRYTLLDAASILSTSDLDFHNAHDAPDFTVLSFSKMFGFPDLGALIVRKQSAPVLRHRKYFGGGAVDVVIAVREQWHQIKTGSLHSALEDGTLPIHSILALRCAMQLQDGIFGHKMDRQRHVAWLSELLYQNLSSMRHSNGKAVCEIYSAEDSSFDDPTSQGPIVAFNVKDRNGDWISNYEVEKVATVRNIHLRTGGLCNPGGTAAALGQAPWEVRKNFSAGFRCGGENDILDGKPTGVIRASLGLMSTKADVDLLIKTIDEFFVCHNAGNELSTSTIEAIEPGQFYVESLIIYPIKSCGGYNIPTNTGWNIRREGLQWDREWCLVHRGTGVALSQKQYPKMALLRPTIDLINGVLRVRYDGPFDDRLGQEEVTVPLSADPRPFDQGGNNVMHDQSAHVCGDDLTAKKYSSEQISQFFTQALNVPCQLVRLSRSERATGPQRVAKLDRSQNASSKTPILFANESPILVISRSSVNRLNEEIKHRGGKAASAAVFRPNVILAQRHDLASGIEQPFAEDTWKDILIEQQRFQMLGPCHRCQMICVDQVTAEKNEEPFATLARTRRRRGKVWFGQHASHVPRETGEGAAKSTIKVGGTVQVLSHVDCEIDRSAS